MRGVKEVVGVMAEKREEASLWRVSKKERKKKLWREVRRIEEERKQRQRKKEKRKEKLVGVKSWVWQYNAMQWVPLITKLPIKS